MNNFFKMGTTKTPPEKYFGRAVELYFGMHKKKFRDDDGFALAPDWNPSKAGMERSALKKILTTLREICEGKGYEWTQERIENDFSVFMEKSLQHNLVKKNFLCCMMNRFKLEILSTQYHPQLSFRLREQWYLEMPEYTVDKEKDEYASEQIIGFLKQQYVLASIVFSEQSVLQSVRTIINFVKNDEFWKTKSLKSIANNMQEIVNKIKSKHGTDKAFSREGLAEEFNRRYKRG